MANFRARVVKYAPMALKNEVYLPFDLKFAVEFEPFDRPALLRSSKSRQLEKISKQFSMGFCDENLQRTAQVGFQN